MLQKLVYAKVPPDKEGKYTIENVVNLKAKKKKKKQPNENTLQNTSSILNNESATLSFESKFESGNLQLAFNTEPNEYQLFLHNDTNTTGYTQWFFFRVSNTRAMNKITFHIMNLLRKKTKYSYGIKIWVYSKKRNIYEKIKWHHTTEDVQYHQNELYRLQKGKRLYYSTLSFEYTFPFDDDDVYFANCIPFTYTDLMKDLNEYQRHENTKYPYFMRKTLCTTLAGNDLDFVSINSTNNHKGMNAMAKEGIVLFARQHPSETVGSWAIKGAIDFLMGNSDEAVYLREHFIFKIVPMMNPDGVISGNTRTSFAGCDLNRRWVNPSDELHPEIYFAKEMIMNFAEKRKVECIVDFHGHFGAFNAFFYANRDKENYAACKFFPFICSKTSKVINFDKCKFSMPKMKSGTGRIDLFRELNIENVYTIETSNFGCLMGEYANMYFNECSLMEIGRDVCLSIMKMHYAQKKEIPKLFVNTISSTIKSRIKGDVEQIENEFLLFLNKKTAKDANEEDEDKQNENEDNANKETPSPLDEGAVQNNTNEDISDGNGEDDDENSESEPSADNIDINEIKKLLPLGKKNKRYKRFPKGKRMKLFHKNVESNLTKKLIQDQPQISSRQQLNKTQFTLPQLKTQTPSNSINVNKQQTSLTLNTINNNTISKPNAPPLQQLTQKQHSPQNSQVTKPNTKNVNETQSSETTQSLIKKPTPLMPIISKKETVIMNSCLVIKVDSHTQTEEIFFKMHWSYFIGSFPIISVRYEGYGGMNRKTRSNNNYTYLTERNEQQNNFNVTIHKRMIMQKKTSNNNMYNYVTQNNGRIEYSQMPHNMNGNKLQNKNMGLYTLANGTILVNRVPKQKSINNGGNSNNGNNNIINNGGMLRSFNALSPGSNNSPKK